LRKALCGIAVGAFIFAVPGVASAQLPLAGGGILGGGAVNVDGGGDDIGQSGLVNVGAQTGDVLPVAVAGPVNVLGSSNDSNSAANAGSGNDNTTAGEDFNNNTTIIRDNTVIVDDGHNGHNDGHNGHNDGHNGDNDGHNGDNDGHNGDNTVVGGDNTNVNRIDNTNVNRNDNENTNVNDIDINIDNRNEQSQSNEQSQEQTAVIDNNDNVTFIDRDGTVIFFDAHGRPHRTTLHKAVLAGKLPQGLLTHKSFLFPTRVGAGSFVGGGGLAKTGQDYGLFIIASLAMISAGWVVSRLGRLNLRPTAAVAGPDPITLLIPDPDRMDEPEAEVEPTPEPVATATPEPVATPAWSAARTDLEDEIAALRRQLDRLVTTG
jgi:hypothetical protein